MQEKSRREETKEPAKSADKPAKDAYDLATLTENSMTLFGVPSYVIAGALHGRPPKETYTKDEMQNLVNEYQNTPNDVPNPN